MRGVILGAAALTGGMLMSCAQPRGANGPLVGSWQLQSLEEPGADGAMRVADATGQFVFTADGHIAVQVMYRSASDGPPAYSFNGYEATFGTYRVDDRTHAFTFHVDGALVRDLVGKDLPRAYEVTDHKLVITSTNPAEHWRVTWQR